MQEKIILYGHNTCPMVPPVVGMLKGAKVNYNFINIHQDESARLKVMEINNGFESVPTLVFPDGSTLTEPSPGTLRRKLEASGYEVPLTAQLMAYIPMVLPVGIMLIFLIAVLITEMR